MPVEDDFERHAEYAAETDRLLHLTKQGLLWIRNQPEAMKALDNWERVRGGYDEARAQARRQHAEEVAVIAAAEVDRGFPLLHAHATVALWSTAESCIESILVTWLVEHPAELKCEALTKVRISLTEFETLDVEDRMRYLLDELKRSTKAELKLGVGRFEALLEALGLTGGVPATLRRDLLELSQIRNVLVHRAGIVDKRLAEACPWLQLQTSNRVQVTHEAYTRYSLAVPQYVGSVRKRLEERRNVKDRNSGDTILNS